MKTLNEIYTELMKDYQRINMQDFLDYCCVCIDGENKKFTSYSEAYAEVEKCNDGFKHIQCFYDEKGYKEAIEKNKPIKIHAEQEIKRLMKERLEISSNDKLDNVLFELAFELGEHYFNDICNSGECWVSDDDKDYLFTVVENYYKIVTKHLPKEKLMLVDC